MEGNPHPFERGNGGADDNLLVVEHRLNVAAAAFNDRENDAFFLKPAVGVTQGTKIFTATNLKLAEVIAVIDHTHLIRFLIPRSDFKIKMIHVRLQFSLQHPGAAGIDNAFSGVHRHRFRTF
jgi:hypothetical protein